MNSIHQNTQGILYTYIKNVLTYDSPKTSAHKSVKNSNGMLSPNK